MFKKKKCSKCGKRIDEKYDFCPYCGNRFNSGKEEDWGMLGKNDFFPSGNEIKLPVGFNALFNSLIKNLSKELDNELRNKSFGENTKKISKDGVSISISTFGNGPPRIKVANLGNKKLNQEEVEKKFDSKIFTKEQAKKFSGLPKEEPKTNVRRLSNKVVYEVEIPKAAAEDVSIVKLENSIEIKAFSKNKAFKKLIPINLPIRNYKITNGKLVLELSLKN